MSNFFQQIDKLFDGSLSINLAKSGGKITVLLKPSVKSDKVKPMQITGTPEELDADFFNVAGKSLEETKGLVHNINSYETALQDAEKDTKKKVEAKTTKKTSSKSTTKTEAKKEVKPKETTGELFTA